MVFTFFAAAERKHTETDGSNRTVGQGANSQGTETERRRWMVRSKTGRNKFPETAAANRSFILVHFVDFKQNGVEVAMHFAKHTDVLFITDKTFLTLFDIIVTNAF